MVAPRVVGLEQVRQALAQTPRDPIVLRNARGHEQVRVRCSVRIPPRGEPCPSIGRERLQLRILELGPEPVKRPHVLCARVPRPVPLCISSMFMHAFMSPSKMHL